MSFPGHAKSIQINREPYAAVRRESLEVYKELREQERRANAELSDLRKLMGHGSPGQPAALSLGDDEIVDDKGNRPTRSLWVGNTHLGMRNSQLYEKFGAFGPIESATTKPMTRYSFVNFIHVKDAIAAWKTLDGKSAFQDDKPLHIRFTAPESEAKQAKEESSEKKTKVERSRANSNKDGDERIWPNGPPPSGPKSHRKDISPPPLRRGGDSYRPLERPEQFTEYDTYRPGLADRDNERDARRKGPDVYRPAASRRPRSRSRSTSRSGSDRDSSCSSRYESPRARRMSSPVPWERNINDRDDHPTEVNLKVQQAKQRAQIIAATFLSQKRDTKSRSPNHLMTSTTINASPETHEDVRIEFTPTPPSNASYSPMSHVSYQDQVPEESSADVSNLDQSLLNSNVPVSSISPNRNIFIQNAVNAASSSVPPSKRLRIEREETCSVVSELTSSTKSSLRRKKCADCKKLGSDLSPLLACSTCPRRFHSGCGDPRPSSCPIKAMFKCGRCIREKKPESKAAALPVEIGKSHLASPPLSLSNNDSNDTTSLSRDVALRIDTTGSNDSSFFQMNTPQTPAPFPDNISKVKRRVTDNRYIGIVDGAADARDATAEVPADVLKDQSQRDFEQISILNMQKYKGVTCHYWKNRGQCWLAEEQCLYAHRDTGVQRPDDRHPSKAWTCWKWLDEHRCPHSEQKCAYAHQDTGLHMTSDGRVSLKHITCVWWIKSNACKWSGATCRFAHEDTGVYALEPGDKRFRGSAISSVRPVPLWKVPTCEQNDQRSASAINIPLRATDMGAHESSASERRKNSVGLGSSTYGADAEGSKQVFEMNFDEIPTYARPQRRVSLMSPGTPADGMQEFAAAAGRSFSWGSLNSDSANVTGCSYSESLLQSNSRFGPETEPLGSESTALNREHANPRLDPRKRKQITITAHPTMLEQSGGLASVPLHQSVVDSTFSENPIHGSPDMSQDNANSVNLQIPASSKTKKCNVCSKIVFNDVLCRGCKESKPLPNHLSPTSPSQPIMSVNVPLSQETRSAKSKALDEVADFVMDDFDSVRPEQSRKITKPTIKLSIKRSASGDNMFIPNKRPKSGMAFSHPGSLRLGRAGPLRNPRINERPPVKTLEQLAREARIQNGKAPDESALSPTIPVPPASNSDIAKVTLHCDLTPPLADVGVNEDKNRAPSDNLKQDPVAVESDANISDTYCTPPNESDETSTSSEADAPDTSYSAPAEPSRRESGREEVKQQQQHDWSASGHSEMTKKNTKTVTRACQDCNERHRRCTHGDSKRVSGPASKVAKTRTPQVDKAKNKASEAKAMSHLKVGIEEPIQFVCDICRRHHKKCLHNELGMFDPSRCAIYIKHRISRPSCYSSAEWERIVEAAESLEQQYESTLSDDSADIRSDIDINGEHVDAESTASSLIYHDEEELLGEKPMPIIQTTPTTLRYDHLIFEAALPMPIDTAFKKAKIKTRLRERHDSWTAEDHKKHTKDLKIRGVMFESESESDDYASDDDDMYEPTLRPVDPLYVSQKISGNLFKVCPGLYPKHPAERSSTWPSVYEKKASRKEEWKNLRSVQLQTRRELFGNPHREVDRMKPDTMVTAIVERVMPGIKDALVPEVQIRQEAVSFRDFLGLPRQPIACLMEDRVTLAYRDAVKDNEYTNLTTSTRGFGRQITEEDRLPVYDK